MLLFSVMVAHPSSQFMRRNVARLVVAAALLLWPVWSHCASAREAGGATGRQEKRFVIIVANNRSLTSAVQPLRYADDDGARWYELLSPIADRAALLTVLDDESQRVFRKLAPIAEPPTSAALKARLSAFNGEMEAARASGFEPVLYLVL